MKLKKWWSRPWLKKWVVESDHARELWQEDRLDALHARIMLAVEKADKDTVTKDSSKVIKAKRRTWRGANGPAIRPPR